MTSMLATLSLDREPPKPADIVHLLPAWPDFGYVEDWLRVVGSLAAAAILIWVVFYFVQKSFRGSPELLEADSGPTMWGRAFRILSLIGLLAYLAFGATFLYPRILQSSAIHFTGTAAGVSTVRLRILTIAATAALLAVMVWPARDLLSLRWRLRRIWAIAKVSLKEAVRRKVLWVFLIVLLFFLFGIWFLPTKPEDQIRSYVQAVFLVFAVLLVVTLSLVASFSIPTDIKNQTIHTILTKPVERFELLLGRFMGYGVLMTGVLAVLTAFSLLYVTRELDREAVAESLKARVTIPALKLQFYENDVPVGKGTNVGKIWEYRSYIGGDKTGPNRQAAGWIFDELPDLNKRESVPCEFAFDIRKTTKGEGVKCSFVCRSWHWEEGSSDEQRQRDTQFRTELAAELAGVDPDFAEFVVSWMCLKYGYYVPGEREITNLRTSVLDLPVALFQDPRNRSSDLAAEAKLAPASYKDLVDQQSASALAALHLYESQRDAAANSQEAKQRDALHSERAAVERQLLDVQAQIRKTGQEASMPLAERKRAFLYRQMPFLDLHLAAINEQSLANNNDKLEVRAKCETAGQYIGMAKADLYLLDKEYPFWFNFSKGACGLWLLLLVVLALNIALSTYLSAIISWLAGLFWLLLGLVRDFVQALTVGGDNAGGGPMEAFYRLTQRKNLTAPVTDTAAFSVVKRSDELTRWFFKGLLWVIPDFDRFLYTEYVAEGFDIAIWNNLFVSLLYLLAWVIPFALLGYYTMKWREVASAQ